MKKPYGSLDEACRRYPAEAPPCGDTAESTNTQRHRISCAFFRVKIRRNKETLRLAQGGFFAHSYINCYAPICPLVHFSIFAYKKSAFLLRFFILQLLAFSKLSGRGYFSASLKYLR